MKIYSIFMLIFIFFSKNVLAQDASSLQDETSESASIKNKSRLTLTEDKKDNAENFFEIALDASVFNRARINREPYEKDTPQVFLSVRGEYHYKAAFFELGTELNFDPSINIGFHIWDDPHWSIDLLIASTDGNEYTEFEDLNEVDDGRDIIDTELVYRDTYYAGFGLRATRSVNNTIIRYKLLTDPYRDNGVRASVRAGKGWQYGRMHWYAAAGLSYSSSVYNQYIYGISAQEATPQFSEFSANSSVQLNTEIGMTYILSKDWLFRMSGGASTIDSGIKRSPLVDKDQETFWFSSLSYVF